MFCIEENQAIKVNYKRKHLRKDVLNYILSNSAGHLYVENNAYPQREEMQVLNYILNRNREFGMSIKNLTLTEHTPKKLMDFTSPADRYLHIIGVKRGATRIQEFESDEEFKDLEQKLQIDSRHKLRIFRKKNGNELIFIGNKMPPQLIRKIIKEAKDIKKLTITDEEQAILDAIANSDFDTYYELCNTFFKEKIIKKQKENFEKLLSNNERINKAQYEEKLKQLQQKVKNREEEIIEFRKRMRELHDTLNGIMLNNAETYGERATELIEFINKNPTIKGVRINREDPQLTLSFEAPVIYYDKEFIKTVIERHPNKFGKKSVKDLFEKCFVTEEYKMIFRQTVRIDIAEKNIGVRGMSRAIDEDIPANPHLNRHACWGDIKNELFQKLLEEDYIQLIQQMQAQIMNLNATDSTVFNKYIESLNDIEQIKVLKDNEIITVPLPDDDEEEEEEN